MGAGLKSGVEVEKYFKLPLTFQMLTMPPCIQGYIDLLKQFLAVLSLQTGKLTEWYMARWIPCQLPLYALGIILKSIKPCFIVRVFILLTLFQERQRNDEFFLKENGKR